MLQKIIFSTMLLSVGFVAIANQEEIPKPPLMIKAEQDKKIREVATYQLKRRFFPVEDTSKGEMKAAIVDRNTLINSPFSTPLQQNRTVTINPEIASEKQTIYSSVNYVTTIVFVDAYGNPWDIKDIGIGAGSSFQHKPVNSYTTWLFPTARYKKSNVAFLLDGLVTPIVFNLEESSEKVDYTLQVKILKAGVNTTINEFSYSPLQSEIANSGMVKDTAILSMSDGITPPDATRLDVTIKGNQASDILAWEYNGSYYVRLRGEVMSPQPIPASHPNIDGLQLFKIPRISSLFIEKDGILTTGVMLNKK